MTPRGKPRGKVRWSGPADGGPVRVDYYHDPTAPEPTSRKPSASVVVRDDAGRVLMLRRADNGLWTIPTGGLKKNETVRACGIRECREETGVEIEVTGLVGVFSDPGHVIAYARGGTVTEVRQPINVCLHARPVGGTLVPDPREALELRWVASDKLGDLEIHPAIRLRIDHALTHPDEPFVD
ncbi:MAG: NUDIX domain-containing protein [Actinobacteria bacterium]|nr:NUDIX domain-containing protein [Actinomycetota bacterium]MBI3687760.1 NUDIX domain-containing protein [Actinomycetota bacterium]